MTDSNKEAPFFGMLGHLASDGHQIQCHVCGKWFDHLGTHVYKKHGITAATYRERFGLNRTASLASPDFQKTQREGQTTRLSKYWELGKAAISNQTAEQRSRKVTPRLQGNLKRAEMNQRPEKLEAQRRAAAEGTLALLSEESKRKAEATRATDTYKAMARKKVETGECPIFRPDVRERALRNAQTPEAKEKRRIKLTSPEVLGKRFGENSPYKTPDYRARQAGLARKRVRVNGRFAPGKIQPE